MFNSDSYFTWGYNLVVEHLPCMHVQVLGLIPSTIGGKKQ